MLKDKIDLVQGYEYLNTYLDKIDLVQEYEYVGMFLDGHPKLNSRDFIFSKSDVKALSSLIANYKINFNFEIYTHLLDTSVMLYGSEACGYNSQM